MWEGYAMTVARFWEDCGSMQDYENAVARHVRLQYKNTKKTAEYPELPNNRTAETSREDHQPGKTEGIHKEKVVHLFVSECCHSLYDLHRAPQAQKRQKPLRYR